MRFVPAPRNGKGRMVRVLAVAAIFPAVALLIIALTGCSKRETPIPQDRTASATTSDAYTLTDADLDEPATTTASDTAQPLRPAEMTALALVAPSRAVASAAAPLPCTKVITWTVPPGTTAVNVYRSDGVVKPLKSLVKNGSLWVGTMDAACTRSQRETITEFVGSKCPCGTSANGKPLTCPCWAGTAGQDVVVKAR